MRKIFGFVVGLAATICLVVAVFLFFAAIFTLSLTSLVFSIVYLMLAGGLSTLSAWLLEDMQKP